MPCFSYSCLIISINSKQAKLKTEARGTLHFWSSLINIGPACCPGQLQLNQSDVYCSGHLGQREERGQLTCVNIASPVAAAGELCGPGGPGTNCHGDTAQLPGRQPPEDTQLSPQHFWREILNPQQRSLIQNLPPSWGKATKQIL